MTLEKLFSETDWTEEALADAVGVDQSTINRLRHKKRQAGVVLSIRIGHATGGKVRPADLPMSKKARRDLLAIQSVSGAERAA